MKVKLSSSRSNNGFSYHSLNFLLLLASSIIGLLILLCIAISFMLPFKGADTPHCKGVYMSPAYAKVHAFDSTHTKFASKYSLYLYREQGKDTMPNDSSEFNLSGTPVLFIPGNAGSYKQARSIAASAANQYFGDYETINNLNPNVNNLDFFTADFNEDFTAFHGRTMLDQSEYLNEAVKFILSLYKTSNHKRVRPTSVILVGHSMGGMVARVMLSLPNYYEDSVNTIITLSTPHNTAPTTFDGDLLNVYKLTDDFWRNGFLSDTIIENGSSTQLTKISSKRLSNVSLVSITGGTLDSTLPTDYTTLTGLIPEDHGFFVSTTGIPGVWTPIDHLAIVWCDQLRKVLAKTLLELVDSKSPSQTYPLKKRMEIMKSNFNPGFEKVNVLLNNTTTSLPIQLKIDMKQLKDSTNERFFQLPKPLYKRNNLNSPPIHLFNIPKEEDFKFSFISSMKPVNIHSLNKSPSPSILLCKSMVQKLTDPKLNKYFEVFDYTTDGTQKMAELECLNIDDLTYAIPKSYSDTSSVLYAVELSSEILTLYDSIALIESNIDLDQFKEGEFVLAELEPEKSSTLRIGDSSLWNLMTRSNEVAIPAHRPLIVDIEVPAIKSSLLAYDIDVRYQRKKNERFHPIISQSFKGETKWHINFDANDPIISIINGHSPYTPYIVNDPLAHGRFKLFSDTSSSDQLIDIYVSVNWFHSLKLIVLKYRLSIIGFPLFITLCVFILQFIKYSNTGFYPSYGESLLALTSSKSLGILIFSFSILSSLTSSSSMLGKMLEILDPVERNELKLMSLIEKTEVEVNLMFMSISEPALWFYGTVMLFISIGLNFLLYNLLLLCLTGLITISRFNIWSHFNVFGLHSLSTQRKVVSIVTLIMLVLLYLPYQFAFVVCALTQVFSTCNSFLSNTSLNSYSTAMLEKDDKKIDSMKQHNLTQNFKNFNLSFTILMLWLVPISVPVLIVWIHDISLKWRTPFSSHHNILAILPIILLIQIMNQGYMIPQPRKSINIFITKFMFIYFAIYSLIFGTRHLYFLHSFFNAACAWLLILIVQDWGNGVLERNNINIKNNSKIQ